MLAQEPPATKGITDRREVIILCTTPPADSSRIAMELIDGSLAACVNITQVKSIYRWEGKICDDTEDLLIIKTTNEMISALTAKILAIHPYELPEVICLPIIGGSCQYLDWVSKEVTIKDLSVGSSL